MNEEAIVTKVKRTTAILDQMDEETMYRLNRGMILMDCTDDELRVLEGFYAKCRRARGK